jgi:hypothetical protein
VRSRRKSQSIREVDVPRDDDSALGIARCMTTSSSAPRRPTSRASATLCPAAARARPTARGSDSSMRKLATRSPSARGRSYDFLLG